MVCLFSIFQGRSFSPHWTDHLLGFKHFAHARQPHVDPCTVMGRLEGALCQLGDPLHLFAKRPPTLWAGHQTGKGLNCAEYPQHDGDIAFGITSNLVERFRQQAFEVRFLLQSLAGRLPRSDTMMEFAEGQAAQVSQTNNPRTLLPLLCR